MNFSTPLAFALLFPLIISFLYCLRKRPATLPVSTTKVFKAIQPTQQRRITTNLIFFIATLLIVLALSGPRIAIKQFTHNAEGIDIMIALDLSGSMLSFDNPKGQRTSLNRLAIAKREIKAFISNRPNDRIGLVVFGTQSYVAAPPTLDHQWLIKIVEQQRVNSVGGDTGIAAPIASAIKRLQGGASTRKVVLLLTDGVNNIEARLTPEQTADVSAQFDITIHTIAIGGEHTYIRNNETSKSELTRIESDVDYQLLQNIAKKTSGSFFRAGDDVALKKVLMLIDKLEPTTRDRPFTISYKELGPLLATIALVLILASFVWRNTRGLTIP